ncbi:unnamed protein product [Rotaria magnacalcarata]
MDQVLHSLSAQRNPTLGEFFEPVQPDLADGTFFGIGNPLLDLSIKVDERFLKKHNLKEGQILLAGNEHQQIFDDIDGKARLASGGSSQNIMRSIAWFLQQPRVATYMGCVGTDFDSTRLQEVAQEAGLNTLYQEHPTLPTGRCAILVTPDSQTRIASLGASEAFTSNFLEVEENWQHIARARVLCSEGFFLVSNREAFMRICEHSHKKRKIFAMTLSAKYICDDPYGSRLLSALPYADIVFGIEDDAKVFARSQLDIESTNLHTIIKAIHNAPKWNMNRPRIVVLSKLKVRTTVATEYEWKRQVNVVDTHGCADAFAGGFLAYRALDKNVDECVRAGLYCAYENLKQLGCLFPSKVSFSPHKSLDDDDDYMRGSISNTEIIKRNIQYCFSKRFLSLIKKRALNAVFWI